MFKFLVAGADKLLEKLHKIQKEMENQEYLEKIGQVVKEDIQERIRTGKTSADGVPWVPWAPSTLVARMRQGTASRGLLYNSGKLLNSFKVVTTKTSFTIGTSSPYSAFLNNGTNRMQARPFMGVSPKARATIKTILDKKIGFTIS